MAVSSEDYMMGKFNKRTVRLFFRHAANHAGKTQSSRKRQGMGKYGIVIILNQRKVLNIFQNVGRYRRFFPAKMIGNKRMIIVAFYSDHTLLPQWSQAGFSSFRTGRIANITEMVNAPAVQALEHVKRGQNGLGFPVTVGHNSDHCLLHKGFKVPGSEVQV